MGITADKLWNIKNKDGLVEYENGDKAWYFNGELHREDGPAAEYADGIKMWHIHGKLHRKDGPAIEAPKDSRFKNQWFLEGIEYKKKDFLKAVSNKNEQIDDKQQIFEGIETIRQAANFSETKKKKKIT